MISLLAVVLVFSGINCLHAQTGTCCYNPRCAIANMWASSINLTRSNVTNLERNIVPESCCPSGGDALIQYNGERTESGLCRCYDGTAFVEQTCEYTAADAPQCANVGSDDPCPDSAGRWFARNASNVDYCAYSTNSSGSAERFVPQRCPTREICIQGMDARYAGIDSTARLDGVYRTNSQWYVLGAATYWLEGKRNYSRGAQLQYYIYWNEWRLLAWKNGAGNNALRVSVPVPENGILDNYWDILAVQETAYIPSGVFFTAGNCSMTPVPTTTAPTTSAPTTSAPTTTAPTSAAPTSAAPTTVAPTTGAPTATTTRDDGVTSTVVDVTVDEGNGAVSNWSRIVFCVLFFAHFVLFWTW